MCIRDSSYPYEIPRHQEEHVAERHRERGNERISGKERTAVSYTHLDVYKRQENVSPLFNRFVFLAVYLILVLEQ